MIYKTENTCPSLLYWCKGWNLFMRPVNVQQGLYYYMQSFYTLSITCSSGPYVLIDLKKKKIGNEMILFVSVQFLNNRVPKKLLHRNVTYFLSIWCVSFIFFLYGNKQKCSYCLIHVIIRYVMVIKWNKTSWTEFPSHLSTHKSNVDAENK